jgi:hypothetical protein
MPLKGPGIFDGFFGTGRDGHVKVTGNLYLDRDMNYDFLILSGTAAGPPKIFTQSFRLNVRNKLIFLTSASISCDGLNAASATSGTIITDGENQNFPGQTGSFPSRPDGRFSLGSLLTLGEGGDGANGSTNAHDVDAAPADAFQCYGGNGGNGGAGSILGFGLGGAGGGTISPASGTSGTFTYPFYAILCHTFGTYFIPSGISGGGGGGGGGAHNITGTVTGTSYQMCGGAGGASGGGVTFVCAREIVVGLSATYVESSSLNPGFPFSGTISPFSGTIWFRVPSQTGTFSAGGGRGGSGLISGGTTGSGGPGGGGGGGIIVIVTSARPRLTGAFGSVSGTYAKFSSSLRMLPELQSGTLIFSVTGGLAGSPGVFGQLAQDGQPGNVFYIDV